MWYSSRIFSMVGARRVVLALGIIYVAVAVGLTVTAVVADQTVGEALISPLLIGASGLVLAYGGYRLPQTNVRSDLFHVVAGWCLRAIAVMLGIVLFGALVGSVDDLVSGYVVLPALASVAGLGMGYHDARARTRALDAEERQREAERYSRELERYHTIVETVNDGIFVVDEDSHFTLVNDAYVELVGYEREELVGSPASLVAAEETDVDEMSDEIRRDLVAGDAETKTYASTVETASGESFEAESTVAPLPEQEDAEHDKVVVVRDVTERNERERRLERQNDRLDSFASLLAHELRNPVTIGQIYSQQLTAESNPEAVEYVAEAFERIENMIDVMLVVARGRDALSENAAVQLADVARDAWAQVDALDATLEVSIDGTIQADETYIRHLFRNLFENSVEHGSTSPRSQAHEDSVEHGSTSSRPKADDVPQTPSDAAHQKSEISEDAVEHGSTSPHSQAHDDAVEHGGNHITVTVGDLPTGFYVEDDGIGIPPEDRDAVFETGYTTAGSNGGMGLGLTFVHEMAEVYEWDCSVTEGDAGGARFEFTNVTDARNAVD